MDQGKNNHIKAKQHDSYITMTVICVLLPLIGLIVGVVYLTKEKVLDRKLGEHMVAMSILWALIGTAGWMFLGVLMRAGSV